MVNVIPRANCGEINASYAAAWPTWISPRVPAYHSHTHTDTYFRKHVMFLFYRLVAKEATDRQSKTAMNEGKSVCIMRYIRQLDLKAYLQAATSPGSPFHTVAS